MICKDNDSAPNQSAILYCTNILLTDNCHIAVKSLLNYLGKHPNNWKIYVKGIELIHEAINTSTNSHSIADSYMALNQLTYLPVYTNEKSQIYSAFCSKYIKFVNDICDIECEYGMFHFNDQQFSVLVLTQPTSVIVKTVMALHSALKVVLDIATSIKSYLKCSCIIYAITLLHKSVIRMNYLCVRMLDHLLIKKKKVEGNTLSEYEAFSKCLIESVGIIESSINIPYCIVHPFHIKQYVLTDISLNSVIHSKLKQA